MIGYSVAIWVGGFLFVGLLVLLPSPYRWFMWIPYSIIFPLVIVFANRVLQRIRAEESAAQGLVDRIP